MGKYSEEFKTPDHRQGPYPEPHSFDGEKLPPDGEAEIMPTRRSSANMSMAKWLRDASGWLRSADGPMPVGLSYPDGEDFGPYIQRCGEGLMPSFSLDFTNSIPFSAGNVHPHTALLLFSLVLNQRPKTIIETGTFYGYSTWFMAEALRLWGDGGMVHTIEWDPKLVDAVVRAHPNVTLHEGRSEVLLPGLVEELGEVQFAFLDSWKREAMLELSQVDRVIPPGGMVVFHDTQFLNTGRKFYEFLLSCKDIPYEVMLLGGIPHKNNRHRFFGNADDRGLLLLHKRGGAPFLNVADSQTDLFGDKLIGE